MIHTTARLRSLLLAVALAAGLGLAGCSAGGSEDASTAAPEPGLEAPEAGSDGDALAEGGAADDTQSARGSRVSDENTSGRVSPGEPAVISVGTLTVQSDDVADARFDLDKVVDALGGSIADEKTTATTDGEVRQSRVVLRIPSKEFDTAMTELAGLGKVTDSTRKAEDVTGQVIDTQARIRAQEQSLQRVEVLFARAQDIRDIVAIEAQLSRRQAELDSLKGQLAYLEDQTAFATITVYLEPAPEPSEQPVADPDDNGFVAGLTAGWHALSSLGTGVATAAGALLPFAAAGVLLGVPTVMVVRRWRVRPHRPVAAEGLSPSAE